MVDRYVLDTSAILAFVDQEEGAAEVERLLDKAKVGECVIDICSITLMEVYYVSLREAGETEAARLVSLMKAWPVTWVYHDEKMLLQAGRLKASYRLSVADALIAAVAKLREATLVHKDPELQSLSSAISLFTLPLKKTSG